ncbi:MAG: cation:proton antiporter, partial [Holophagales bacterium]|nr:cation:proton antiporter [Holophagales bacterium]
MTLFQIIALVIVSSAVFSVISERVFQLPKVIGPMLVAVLLAGILGGLEALGIDLGLSELTSALFGLDFGALVMDGLLGFLLFAGAMHLPLKLLEEQSRTVLSLAIVSTVVSTAVVGTLFWSIAWLVNFPIGYLQALTFGALISPTDPVSVLAVLKNAKLPKRLEVIISGESLFNDGIGVGLFLVLSTVAFGSAEQTLGGAIGLASRELLGGPIMGLLVGGVAYYLLENTREQGTQVLITLAVASGGYSLAQALHVSGPLAMVVAGLIVGNFGLRETMERESRKVVGAFWTVADEVATAVLFVLVGILVLSVPSWTSVGLGFLAVALHLLGRFVGVLASALALKTHVRQIDAVGRDFIALLTWSALR